jgi:hypothetical protein
MKHWNFLTTLLLISIFSSYANNKYTLETELPTLKLSFEEFWDILDNINSFINKLDKSFDEADIYIKFTDGRTDETILNPAKNSPVSLKKAYLYCYKLRWSNIKIRNLFFRL